jgi:transposase
MQIITNSESVKTAIVACDVSKDSLSFVVHLGRKVVEETIANTTVAIDRWLSVMTHRAGMADYERLQVVAEATGIYHFALMRIARRKGCDVALVSAEAVAKMRVIESNDTGKTDIKDPHVIHSLARLGKTQICRELEGHYLLLREWHKEYDHADRQVVEAKGSIHTLLKQLFPDFGFSTDFLYTRSGVALFELYGANPHQIVKQGKSRFARRMRKAAPRIRQQTVNRH